MTSYLRSRPLCSAIVLLVLIGGASTAGEPRPGVDFSRDILPILSDNCFRCHGPDARARKAKLRLDTQDGALRKTEPVIVPGKSAESELIRRITSSDADEVMPPPASQPQADAAQVEVLKRWIDDGAPLGHALGLRDAAKRPALPAVSDRHWPRNADRSLRPRSAGSGRAAAVARGAKETLIRRVTLDLTGLPPTPAGGRCLPQPTQSPDAYEKVVDRLLASPALRRAHGLGLARRRPLRRHQRLPGRRRTDHVALARLGRRGAQRATCRSTSSPSGSWPATCCPNATRRAEARHRLLPQSHDQRRRRPDRRGEPRRLRHGHDRDDRHRLARPDAQLLPLPRPQVRSAHAARLLPPLRLLQPDAGQRRRRRSADASR